MSHDVKTQVHAYGNHLTDDQAPITDFEVAALIDRVRELPIPAPVDPPHSQRRQAWLIAAAAAGLVLLLVGALPLLLAGGRDDTSPATTVTTSLAPSTTTSLAPTSTTVVESEASPRLSVVDLPDGASAGWRWVPTGLAAYNTGGNENVNGFYIGRFSDGTYFAWNAGWLVDGPYDGSLGDDPVETLLLSPDGVTWSPGDLPFTQGALSYGILGPRFAIRTLDPGPFDAATYEGESHYWTTNNGIEWFEAAPALVSYPWHEIDGTIVANAFEGLAVSEDGGVSFEMIEGGQFVDFQDRALFVAGDTFRLLQWEGDVWTLWSSQDGRTWRELGPVPDLHDYFSMRDRRIAVLADGRVLLSAQPGTDRPDTLSTWSLWMVSDDAGRTWQELDTAPTRRSGNDERAPLTWQLSNVDGWTLASTEYSDNVTDLLATRDGKTWVLLDPHNGVHPVGVGPGGAVRAWIRDQDGKVMLWIALPPDE